jgi:hypothetical protein
MLLRPAPALKFASQSEQTNDCRQIVLVRADIVQDAFDAAFDKPRRKRSSLVNVITRHTMPETRQVNGYILQSRVLNRARHTTAQQPPK